MSESDLRKAEALSALMDGEVDELELHRTLKDYDEDELLRASWHRYHLVSAAIKRDLPDQIVDISAAVRDAISVEKRPSAGSRRWLQPITRFAVAASVTVVAVFGVQQYGSQQQEAQLAVTQGQAPAVQPMQLPSGYALPQIPVRTVSATQGGQTQPRPVEIKQAIPDKETYDQVQRYLNGLMLRHTENAALNTHQGMMPFARVPNLQDEP